MNKSGKLLLHICCAPCLIYPYLQLKKNSDFEFISGYFFNPNIYPGKEYDLRFRTVENYSQMQGIDIIYNHKYNKEEFNKINQQLELDLRCEYCYRTRLENTVIYAYENNFSHFSTTLLFSIYQKHNIIQKIALEHESKYGISFYYEDFRPGWKEAVEYSKKIKMYRQKYCGCISSCKHSAISSQHSTKSISLKLIAES